MAYVYDANGNLTSDATRNFLWDDANRLSRVTIKASGANIDYAYGPDGARVRKITAAATCSAACFSAGGSTHTKWLD